MAKKNRSKQQTERVTPSRAMTPFEEMEQWFDRALPRAWMHRWGWPSWGELTRPLERLAPRIDVIDRDDEVVVRAEVPGVRKEDLDVSLTDSAVTIKGSTRHEQEDEKGDYYRAEIATGAFARSVGLPSAVDTDQAKATFQDGILEIKIPKLSKAHRRRIEVD